MLKKDGSVWCWKGAQGTPNRAMSSGGVALSGVTRLAGGGSLLGYCAIDAMSKLWCWGFGQGGRLGNGGAANAAGPGAVLDVSGKHFLAKAISLGTAHACAVATDGTTWCWGANSGGQIGVTASNDSKYYPVQVTDLLDVASDVGVGSGYSCALKKDTSVWCWGGGTAAMSSVPRQISIGGVPLQGVTRLLTNGLDTVWAIRGDAILAIAANGTSSGVASGATSIGEGCWISSDGKAGGADVPCD